MYPEKLRSIPIDTDEALAILERTLREFGHRGTRIHANAAQTMNEQHAALEGLCGGCAHCCPTKAFVDGRMRVTVGCDTGQSPRDLYRDRVGMYISVQALEREVSCPAYEPAPDTSPVMGAPVPLSREA